MLKNLPALFKRSRYLFFLAVFFLSGAFLSAQDESDRLNQMDQENQAAGDIPAVESDRVDQVARKIVWFRSNASGMALEMIPSRVAALRNEYCLSVETIPRGGVPDLLAPYYDDSYLIELRILYEKGREFRRQWIFRDSRNCARLTASGNSGLFDGGSTGNGGGEKEKRTGFIEIKDAGGALVREFRFEDDLSEWEYRFFYQEKTLLRAETWFKEAPAKSPAPSASEEGKSAGEAGQEETPGSPPSFVLVFTDYYRYSRFGSLRAIERVIHEGGKLSRISFPRIVPDLSPGEELAVQHIAYSSEFLLAINSPESAKVSYALDNRGRIISETWKDDDGKVVGEYRNTWSADRLQSVSWKSDDDERLVEYEYDDKGNRIVERNYRRGVLERSVTSRNGRETEEIYMNGRLILRALWEKGLKISEERITRP